MSRTDVEGERHGVVLGVATPNGAILDVPERLEDGALPPASQPLATRAGSRTRVLIGIRDLALHQEVLDHIGRSPGIEVVGSARDIDGLRMAIGRAEVDAAVSCPGLASSIDSVGDGRRRPVLFVVSEEMTVPVLRLAIEAGAQGAFCWPEERQDLTEVLTLVHPPDKAPRSARGRTVAIMGARGGVGTTFVASHLAASIASRKLSVDLVDMDPRFSDLTLALGIAEGSDARSVIDLLPVADELSPQHVEQALYHHPAGFGVLLRRPSVPGDADPSGHAAGPLTVPVGLFAACVALLAGGSDAVLMHVGRSSDGFARVAADLADSVVLVTGLELMSLYGARRLVASLGLEGSDRVHVVTNAARRSDVSVRDAERVLGVRIEASVRFDPVVGAAQDRAQLVSRRRRGVWRDVDALASIVMQPAARRSPEA